MCDGSSAHSRYKRKYENPDANDDFLFAPIKMHPINDPQIYAWHNQKASAGKPIKFDIP